ncbi:MAG TPA: glycosyltransferase family A protein [Bryobacteraceae bacterium]|nr:glycosyltransferase family A protein [Bryobacteraceae bacterium]
MEPESSLIIITLDRADLLGRTLEGLTCQTRPVDEILVVDNGPDAQTERVVRSFEGRLPIRHLAEPKRGYGRARNRGLTEAQGGIIYFLDDDCVPEPDWAAVLRGMLEAGSADLVGGSRLPGQPGFAARLEYLSTDGPVLSPLLDAGPARHLSTSNLALRREVVEKVGQFDATLVMCEDRDYTTRARTRGFRLYYEPRARVTHFATIYSLSDYLAKMRHYGHGTSQYFVRWRGEEPLGRLFPESPAARLVLLPALAAAGTAYLVARNLPQCPDAVPLSPWLFLGQMWWHWGGFEAMREASGKDR